MRWFAIFGPLTRGRVLRDVMARVGAAGLVWLCVFAVAEPAGAQERTRGITVTEDRIALVIGNAAYKSAPLLNPINDARLIADTLTQAGFKVSLHENLDRRGLFEAMRAFGNRLNDRTIALMYYAGHAVQLRDTNYLIPIDAEVRSEDEIPYAGLDVGFMLGRMSHARSRINIVILDACRDNPFVGKTGPVASGLAQMDAPVGTLLAFATAPGKVAEDGAGANTPYTNHLAKNLLTPGLPVEFVFKRVREAVVRETSGRQVPWESSSLQGEFAFVPGMASTASADADVETAGEIAFWNSIQASARAEEYRAYLRQYPRGRFAELAKTRIAASTRDSAPQPGGASALARPDARPDARPRPDAGSDTRTDVAAVAPSTSGARGDLLPRAGDTWRYRVQDRFRIGDLFMTATVADVTPAGVTETWSSTSDAQVRTSTVPLSPGFNPLPGWTLTPPEFAPYLLASGALRSGEKIGDQRRRIDEVMVPLKVSVEGEEDVTVVAGRFRATKLVLRGQTKTRSARGPLLAEHVVWYAPDVKRIVKYSVSTKIGASLQEATVFELTEYRLN